MSAKEFESRFQIGKKGLTQGGIESLIQDLKTHKQIRISVLKSSNRNRETIKTLAQDISQKVPIKTTFKIIGFTIVLRKSSSNKK